MKRGLSLQNSVAFVSVVVSVSCLLIVIMSAFRLPELSMRNNSFLTSKAIKSRVLSHNEEIGKFGEMMIQMLPEDLAFTIFIPSEKAFEHDLKLTVHESLVDEKMNDTYAILSRILGFSAIPQALTSDRLASGEEVSLDSISGYRLYISKDSDNMLVVNSVPAKRLDLKSGEIVVHIINGVIMDAEFEQSVRPDFSEGEED